MSGSGRGAAAPDGLGDLHRAPGLELHGAQLHLTRHVLAVVRDVAGTYGFIPRAVYVKDWRLAFEYSPVKHEKFVKKRDEYARAKFEKAHDLAVTLNLA